MNITCPHCQTKLNLPDDKIPKDRDSSFKCPKCREAVHIKAGQATANTSGQSSAAAGPHQAEVLICVADAQARARITEAVARSGWHAESASSADQALKLLEYEIYPLMVMDDAFDTGGRMAGHLNELDMSLRRRICLVLIHGDAGTGDAMAALRASANMVVNAGDVTGRDEAFLCSIFLSAREDHENFYRVYNDSMRAVGKA